MWCSWAGLQNPVHGKELPYGHQQHTGCWAPCWVMDFQCHAGPLSTTALSTSRFLCFFFYLQASLEAAKYLSAILGS